MLVLVQATFPVVIPSPVAQPIPFHQDPAFLRAQTLLILIALVCIVVATVSPLLAVQLVEAPAAKPQTYTLYGNGAQVNGQAVDAGTTPGMLLGLLAAGLALPILALWRYRNRAQALRYVNMGAFYLLLVLGGVFLIGHFWQQDLRAKGLTPYTSSNPQQPTVEYLQYGLAFVFLAALALMAAGRRIKSDIAKLRSAERFR